MRQYEMIVGLKPALTATAQDEFMVQMEGWIKKYKGIFERKELLGHLYLAYDIQNLGTAHFMKVIFQGSGETVSELERQLHIDENVLRTMTFLPGKSAKDKASAKLDQHTRSAEPVAQDATQGGQDAA